MSSGYVYLQSNPEFPDRVQCLHQTLKPDVNSADENGGIRYIAHFANEIRAYQQLQGLFSKHIIDSDQGLFRVSLLDAIATIETCPLRSERIWIDPSLDDTDMLQLDNKIEQVKAQRLSRDKLWKTVGFGFVVLFLAMLLLMARTVISSN